MRILLVEDDAELGQLIARSLKRRGFITDQVSRVEDARAVLLTEDYKVVIVDRMLPDGEGLQFVSEIRRKKMLLPILVLTAMDGVTRRVEGLEAGADDYLEKPFDMNELVARLRALGRRSAQYSGDLLMGGRLSFDPKARTASTPEGPIKLSQKEIILVEQLLRRFDVTVLRDNLMQAVYGIDDDVSPNALEAHVSRLRKKLNVADAGVSLHTIPGIGYLMKEAVK